MSAKEQATLDIKDELSRQGKSFLAFHKELNPVMRKLVSNQIRQQISMGCPLGMGTKPSSQLMAHCFFNNGTVKLDNYSGYYESKQLL